MCHATFNDRREPAKAGFLFFAQTAEAPQEYRKRPAAKEETEMTDRKSEELRKDTVYRADPLTLFHSLTKAHDNTMLLESAEINSKAGTKSELLVNSAVRFSCSGRTVTAEALTGNGLNAVKAIAANSPKEAACSLSGNVLTISYPAIPSGLDEDSRLKAVSVFDCLRTAVGKISCNDHDDLILGGCFSYDLIASFEKLPEIRNSSNTCPDYCFYLPETTVHVDHISRTAEIRGFLFSGENEDAEKARIEKRIAEIDAACRSGEDRAADPDDGKFVTELRVNLSDGEFCRIVEKLKGNIRRGDIFQVVPSRIFSLTCPDCYKAYRTLKETNPSPYMFFQNDRDFVIFGASPESSVKYTNATRQVEMYPIAGTMRRGFGADGKINLDLDGKIELDMRMDIKETTEHLMLVDLARNDIARISRPGTRHLTDLLKVDRYSQVMHLVSHVVGELREDLDALNAYQACMNMGTLTGSPKIRATELIREAEGERRGSYGGAIGYITGKGDMDTCIVIRSAFVKDGIAYIQAGAGIVFDSVPQNEANETRNKAAAVIKAIAEANGFEPGEIKHV